MREWFGQLVMYSMTADNEIHRIKEAMLTMPAHPDVADALTKLRDNGFRLVALTNSPPNPDGQSPLEHAGLGGFSSGSSASIPGVPSSPTQRSTGMCAKNSTSRPQSA
jgi:phosphoglycolate phosphatase-like HAD superfamily hydrolase